MVPKKAGCGHDERRTRLGEFQIGLHIGVAGRQHGGEARGFFLAAAAFTGFLKMAVAAHCFQGALAVNLLLQPAQRPVHRLAFF